MACRKAGIVLLFCLSHEVPTAVLWKCPCLNHFARLLSPKKPLLDLDKTGNFILKWATFSNFFSWESAYYNLGLNSFHNIFAILWFAGRWSLYFYDIEEGECCCGLGWIGAMKIMSWIAFIPNTWLLAELQPFLWKYRAKIRLILAFWQCGDKVKKQYKFANH